MTNTQSNDLVVPALSALVPGGVERGQLIRPGGRRLSWVETAGPADGPTIILAHGAGDTVLDWAPILPRLAKQFRVVAYDRAGLGASDPIRRLTLDSQVEDLVALMDTIGPANLVGHSWGGLLVQFAAAARPDAVRGLVLVDPTHEGVMAKVPIGLKVSSEISLAWMVLLSSLGRLDSRTEESGRDLVKQSTDDAEIRAMLTEAYVASYAKLSQVASIRSENRLATNVRLAQRARAAAPPLDVPMRVLTATRGKPPALQRLSHDMAEQTAAAYPKGAHIVVPDSGHYIQQDQPAATAAAIIALAAPPEPPHPTR